MRRRLRHWKQQYNTNSDFIWNRSLTWEGKKTKVGKTIPKSLAQNKRKLRAFWEAGVIQLAEFVAPNVRTGIVEEPLSISGKKFAKESIEEEVFSTAPEGMLIQRLEDGSLLVTIPPISEGEESQQIEYANEVLVHELIKELLEEASDKDDKLIDEGKETKTARLRTEELEAKKTKPGIKSVLKATTKLLTKTKTKDTDTDTDDWLDK